MKSKLKGGLVMNECWLHGKTVVVTGASGGMGAGIAGTLIKSTAVP